MERSSKLWQRLPTKEKIAGKGDSEQKKERSPLECGNRTPEVGRQAEWFTGDNRFLMEHNFRYSSVKNNMCSNAI